MKTLPNIFVTQCYKWQGVKILCFEYYNIPSCLDVVVMRLDSAVDGPSFGFGVRKAALHAWSACQ